MMMVGLCDTIVMYTSTSVGNIFGNLHKVNFYIKEQHSKKKRLLYLSIFKSKNNGSVRDLGGTPKMIFYHIPCKICSFRQWL